MDSKLNLESAIKERVHLIQRKDNIIAVLENKVKDLQEQIDGKEVVTEQEKEPKVIAKKNIKATKQVLKQPIKNETQQSF